MANLSREDEIFLANTLNQYWSKVSKKFHHDLTTESEEESNLSFSWQTFIDDENLNIFNNTFEPSYDDAITSEPHWKKEEKPCDLSFSFEHGAQRRNTPLPEEYVNAGSVCVVDGASVGDVPLQFAVEGLLSHELPVKGTFVHPKITPGFSYSVRPLDSHTPFFDGRSLCLQRIGMGYGKRLTFAGDSLHENENYFWSDSNPNGYGFLLNLVHAGDKFTVLDSNDNLVALLEVSQAVGPQKETSQSIKSENSLRKEATVILQCKIKYFEQCVKSCNEIVVTGVAVAVKKPKSSLPASVVEVKECAINGESHTLIPQTFGPVHRSKFVSGDESCDIPASYYISGLKPNELPVIGALVDPNIIPGLKYKVRPIDSRESLFGGKALTLLSIGRGYGKRLTFAGESLKENDNYFWSDSNPSGYGFTLEVVSKDDSYRILNSFGDEIGMSQVFNLCGPQVVIEPCPHHHNKTYSKRVKVSFASHLTLVGHSDQITTRVAGVASVTREGRSDFEVKIQHLKFPYLLESQDILGEAVTFVKVSDLIVRL